jgi:hypothetical protein
VRSRNSVVGTAVSLAMRLIGDTSYSPGKIFSFTDSPGTSDPLGLSRSPYAELIAGNSPPDECAADKHLSDATSPQCCSVPAGGLGHYPATEIARRRHPDCFGVLTGLHGPSDRGRFSRPLVTPVWERTLDFLAAELAR